MSWKSKLVLGVLTALAMMFLTYALPRGGPMRDAAVVQFPVTVGVWAIFVLLFVKLKEAYTETQRLTGLTTVGSKSRLRQRPGRPVDLKSSC